MRCNSLACFQNMSEIAFVKGNINGTKVVAVGGTESSFLQQVGKMCDFVRLCCPGAFFDVFFFFFYLVRVLMFLIVKK